MHDVDQGSARANVDQSVASATGAAVRLPELLFDGGASATLAAFLRKKSLPPSETRFERPSARSGFRRVRLGEEDADQGSRVSGQAGGGQVTAQACQ